MSWSASISRPGSRKVLRIACVPCGRWWRIRSVSEGNMDLHPDFSDLLAEFVRCGVRFVLLGGYGR